MYPLSKSLHRMQRLYSVRMCLANYSCVRDQLQNCVCPELLAFHLELLSIVLQMANLRSRFLMGKWVSKCGCRMYMGWLPRKKSQRRFWGFFILKGGSGGVGGCVGRCRQSETCSMTADCGRLFEWGARRLFSLPTLKQHNQ